MALIHCPECGKEISDTAKICPNCGVKIKKPGKVFTITMKKKTFQTIRICLIAGFAAIALSIAGTVYYHQHLSPAAQSREKALESAKAYALEYGDRLPDSSTIIPYENMVFEIYENGNPNYYHIVVRDKNGPKYNVASFVSFLVNKKTFEISYVGEVGYNGTNSMS